MQIFGSTTSPRTVLSKHAMNFVHDYGLNTPNSTLPPDIMLRDPLDHEFILNRKMAKKYYESQLSQKMGENKQQKIEEIERKKKVINDNSAKKVKAISEMNKVNNQIL